MAISLLCLLVLTSSALAVNVISVPVFKPQGASGGALRPRHLLSRSTITEILANNETGGSYMATVTVGTPPQSLSLVLDTGSSDVFVLSKTADECTSARLQAEYGGCTGGVFDSTKSSTFKTVIKGGFSIEYADKTGSSGDYISDTLRIGGATITGLQMGLALKTTTGVGIMGIGYDTDEASKTEYPSIIDQMVSQGLINTKLYSLYLDDLASSTGSILFGGIDTAKFSGTLIGLPIQSESAGLITSFTVLMTSLTVVDPSGTSKSFTASSFSAPVILDSGTSLTYLPDTLVASIVSYLNADDDTNGSGNIFVDCNLRTSQSGLTFNYGFGGSDGPVIKVPITEFIIDIDGSIPGRLPFANTCVLGIMGAGTDDNLLGDTFLRSAYVVYDIQNNEIALAQTHFDSTAANIQEVPVGATAIPLVSGVASQATLSPTSTGFSLIVYSTTANSAAGTAKSSANPASTSSTSSKSTAIRSVPAFDMGAVLVLGLSCLFMLAGGVIFAI